MDRCIISNQGLAMVGAVESLVYLSLANCSGFTDAGLANLNNLKQLKHLVRPTTLLHARRLVEMLTRHSHIGSGRLQIHHQ